MGDYIGKYEIEAIIGEGAFGRVYRAYDPTVNRPVAIKVLTAEGRELISRFRTEASAAGNLRHKNIVTIYEFGEHKGRPFIAMELLEGEDLSLVIARHESLTLLEKIRIMSQAAEGLHCAHSNGVLHRDVKPANIKLLADGTVKILDFGIARVTRDRDATRLTQKGDLLGTILYMAPEQFSDAEINRLCDIFAYGVIYYELLSGCHPFAAPDPQQAMFKITFEDPPPLRQLVPTLPEEIEHVVMRAIQKDRETRYQSLRDLLIDVKPTLLALERQRASALLVVARELFARGELEAAEAKAIEVIDLDLGLREAHEIREAVQKELHLRIVRPKVESLLRTAGEDMARRRFADAVANCEAAMRLDRTNAAIRSELERARNLQERARSVSRLVLEARIALEQDHPDGAQEKIGEALALDPDHPGAQQLRERIERAIGARREQARLESALRQAEALIEARQPEAAIAALEELAAGGSDDRVITVLERARDLREEIARATRRAEGIAAAARLLVERHYADAGALLGPLQEDFPDDGEVATLAQAAWAGIRAEASAKERAQIRVLLERGAYAEALQAADLALRQYPEDAELAELRMDATRACDAQALEAAIGAALDTARGERAHGRLEEAIECVDTAVRQMPGEERLMALRAGLQAELDAQRRAAELAGALDQATAEIRASRYAEAVERLRSAQERFPEDGHIVELLNLAESSLRRMRRVDEALAEAEGCAQAERKLAVLEDALRDYPDAAELLDARRAVMAEQRAAAIGDALARCTDLRQSGSLREALDAVRAALADFPGEPKLVELLAEIQGDLDAFLQRWKQAQALAADARAAEEVRDFDAALEFWVRAQAADPGYPDLDSEMARMRGRIADRQTRRAGLLSDLDVALEADDVDRASGLLEAAEAEFAGAIPRELAAKRAHIESLAAAKGLLQEARHAFSQGRHVDAARLFAEAARRFGGNAPRLRSLAGELAEMGIMVAAREWRAAQPLLETATQIDRASPRVAALAKEITQRQRDEAVANATKLSRTREEAGDFAGAEQSIVEAIATYPGDASLLRRREELLAAARERARLETERRAREVAEAVERSQALEAAEDLAGAEMSLQQALADYPREAPLERRLEQVRASIAAHRAREQQREEALRLISEWGVEAGRANQRRLRRIRQEMDRLAAQNAENSEIESRVVRLRRAVDERLEAMARPKPRFRRIRQELDRLALRDAFIREIESRVVRLRSAVAERLEAFARSQPRLSGLAARWRNPLWSAAGALATAAIVLVWYGLGPKTVILSSELSGAEVRIGGQTCTTPRCTLKLRPGAYTLAARKDGYEPISESVTIGSSKREIRLPLTLRPLPELLEIHSDFQSGTVYIDGVTAGELQDGGFTRSGLLPGRHAVRVSADASEFEAEWTSAPAQVPLADPAVAAKNASAAVITNFGKAGTLVCNCAAQPITIDDAPGGRILPGNVVQLPGLAAGQRIIRIGERLLVADIGPNPAVRIFLAAERSQPGSLVVETGVDNPRIFVDDRLYAGAAEHGTVRIPVSPGEHTVRAECEGCQASGSKHVQIGTSEEKRISLRPRLLPATLDLAQALPGAAVKIDGRTAGEVDPKGNFRGAVSPGSHRIELSKDGYTPVQLSPQFRPGQTLRPLPYEIAMNRIPVAPNPGPLTERVQPESQESQDWEKVKNSTNAGELEDYLRKYQGGAHAGQVNKLLVDLRQAQQTQQQTEQAARRATEDENAWNSASASGKDADLRDYLNKFPNGKHRPDAENAMKRNAAAEREKEAVAAADKADKNAVLAAIRSYEQAYNSMKVQDLTNLWSSMPKFKEGVIRNEFKSARKIVYRLTPQGSAVIRGDTATLECKQHLELIGRGDGAQNSSDELQLVTLSRRGYGWAIKSIDPR
jgi:hypothetical protein